MEWIRDNQSKALALLLAIIVLMWMLSGIIFSTDKPQTRQSTDIPHSTKVQTTHSLAQQVTKQIIVIGKTAANRKVLIKSEIEASVLETPINRGIFTKKDTLLVTLDPRERAAALDEAKARVQQRSLEYEATKRLQGKGLNSESDLAEAQANLDAARASAEKLKIELSHTRILAPFDGILNDRMVETGDYAGKGDPLIEFLELNPLKIIAHISEVNRPFISTGQRSLIKLATEQELEGTITYVSSESDERTRTFQAEVEVDNPDNIIQSGITAEITIESGKQFAHLISPGILELNSDNQLGIKTVNSDNIVQFFPVKILRNDPNGIWVYDLPKELDIITIGQGYVKPGDKVETILSSQQKTP